MKITDRDLMFWYKKANKRYFNNVLPVIPVRFAPLKGIFGKTVVWRDPMQALPVCIYIGTHIREWQSLVILTLLHEMIHVSKPLLIGHGKKFNKEMMKLARKGAFDGLW